MPLHEASVAAGRPAWHAASTPFTQAETDAHAPVPQAAGTYPSSVAPLQSSSMPLHVVSVARHPLASKVTSGLNVAAASSSGVSRKAVAFTTAPPAFSTSRITTTPMPGSAVVSPETWVVHTPPPTCAASVSTPLAVPDRAPVNAIVPAFRTVATS